MAMHKRVIELLNENKLKLLDPVKDMVPPLYQKVLDVVSFNVVTIDDKSYYYRDVISCIWTTMNEYEKEIRFYGEMISNQTKDEKLKTVVANLVPIMKTDHIERLVLIIKTIVLQHFGSLFLDSN